ncbi:MAG: hypothetical protein WBO54_06390 [Thermoanaerobaculia bacterium]
MQGQRISGVVTLLLAIVGLMGCGGAEEQAQSERLTPALREFGSPPDPEDKLWKQLRALGYIQ